MGDYTIGICRPECYNIITKNKKEVFYMKRTIGLVLCLLFLLSSLTAFAGCNKKSNGTEENTTKTPATTIVAA